MVADVPKPKVAQDLFDDVQLFDKADYTHYALAIGTGQRVYLIDFLDQTSPIPTELFGRNLVGDDGGDDIIRIIGPHRCPGH